MEKYLVYDDEVRTLQDHNELWEYLDFRRKHDVWVNAYINELAAVGIPNEPLFLPQYCSGIRVEKKGFSIDVGDIDYEKTENEECIRDTGLFLVFPYRNKLTVYPTRTIAYNTICQRAEDACGTMFRFDPKPNKGVLPVQEKAKRLTRDYQLYSDNCKILLRDRKVSAVLSKEYVILPPYEVVACLEDQLRMDHPGFCFDRGSVSHEFLCVEYLMNDPMMEGSFLMALNDAGADVKEVKVGIRFSTSDVGISKVYASIFYDADGVRATMGLGIAMEHKGKASVELFGEKLEDLGMLFKECEELIEQLGNTDIQDVAGTVRRIREVYSFLPKAISEQVEKELAARYPNGGTAVDVYLALNDIIQRHAKINDLSPTRYLDLSEQVARLMKLPFEKIDSGEDWNR